MYKKNREKIFTTLFLVLSIVIPQVSLASAISLRSSTSTTEPSKTFILSVYTDPKSVASYTAQANIKFPADLISVESFTYASSWFPVVQAGYDSIDNTSGKLIKTAGYPGGFTSETLLGTMTIKVKKAGTITLSTNKESYILDIDSNNTLNTYGSFSITASSTVVAPTTPTTPTKTPTTPTTPTKTSTTPKTDTVKADTTKEVTTSDTSVTENIPEQASVADVPKEKSLTRKIALFVGVIFVAVSAYLGFK